MLALAEPATLDTLNSHLGAVAGMVTWLYVLIGLVAVFLAWGQRRIARNQVEMADLLRKAVERLEKDIEPKAGR
jgi:hypothetical protein